VKKNYKNTVKRKVDATAKTSNTASLKNKTVPKKSNNTRELSKSSNSLNYLKYYNYKFYLDHISAEKECKKIGYEKGFKIGIEKGEKIGIEKGEKKARKAEIKMAFIFIKNNNDINKISQYSDLSREELSEIYKFLNDSNYKIPDLAKRLNITKDELIIQTGFFKRKTNSVELYLLKDPDMTESLYQRIIKVGTISVTVDGHGDDEKIGRKIYLKNIEDAKEVRKILRDSIEADVMERKITYFDKV